MTIEEQIKAKEKEIRTVLQGLRGPQQYQNFKNKDLTGQDFTGQDLSGSNFVGTILNGCNFTDCKLHYCNFKDAIDSSAIFSNSKAKFSVGLSKNNPGIDFDTPTEAEILTKDLKEELEALRFSLV